MDDRGKDEVQQREQETVSRDMLAGHEIELLRCGEPDEYGIVVRIVVAQQQVRSVDSGKIVPDVIKLFPEKRTDSNS